MNEAGPAGFPLIVLGIAGFVVALVTVVAVVMEPRSIPTRVQTTLIAGALFLAGFTVVVGRWGERMLIARAEEIVAHEPSRAAEVAAAKELSMRACRVYTVQGSALPLAGAVAALVMLARRRIIKRSADAR